MLKTLKNIISHNRILTSVMLVIPFFFFARPGLLTLSIGLPVILLGEVIRIYASGYIYKGKEITMDGPYSLTRNPLYLGNFFLGLGFSIAAGNVFFPIIFIILFFFIYHATIEQEEAFLSNKFGEVYAHYKAKTSRFFPTPSSIRNSVNPVRSPHIGSNERTSGMKPSDRETSNGLKGIFRWELVKKHREYNTWIGMLIGILLLVVKFLAV